MDRLLNLAVKYHLQNNPTHGVWAGMNFVHCITCHYHKVSRGDYLTSYEVPLHWYDLDKWLNVKIL